jgi:hypothetical protein
VFHGCLTKRILFERTLLALMVLKELESLEGSGTSN